MKKEKKGKVNDPGHESKESSSSHHAIFHENYKRVFPTFLIKHFLLIHSL